MEPISTSLKQKKLPTDDKPIRVKFQIRALEMAQKLGIELKGVDGAGWFYLFKLAERNKKVDSGIGKAFSYLTDYPKPLTNIQKMKFFYWLVFHKGENEVQKNQINQTNQS